MYGLPKTGAASIRRPFRGVTPQSRAIRIPVAIDRCRFPTRTRAAACRFRLKARGDVPEPDPFYFHCSLEACGSEAVNEGLRLPRQFRPRRPHGRMSMLTEETAPAARASN